MTATKCTNTPHTTSSLAAASAALTESQLAMRWSISRKTLQAWRLRGGGPRFLRIGTAIRYMLSDVTAYESINTHDSTSSIETSSVNREEV